MNYFYENNYYKKAKRKCNVKLSSLKIKQLFFTKLYKYILTVDHFREVFELLLGTEEGILTANLFLLSFGENISEFLKLTPLALDEK